jgi:hypothetical protein
VGLSYCMHRRANFSRARQFIGEHLILKFFQSTIAEKDSNFYNTFSLPIRDWYLGLNSNNITKQPLLLSRANYIKKLLSPIKK